MPTLRSTQSLAMAFVLGALLVGGVLGFTADRVLGRDENCTKALTRTELRARFADRLELTTAQRVKIDSILDGKRAIVDSLQASIRPALTAVSDTTVKRIDALLDAKQRVKFAQLRSDRQRREREDSARGIVRR